MEKVNLAEKLALFSEHWSPRIVGELNGQHVKLAKLEGEFVWHHHEDEDELFLVLVLVMRLRGREVVLVSGLVTVRELARAARANRIRLASLPRTIGALPPPE